MGQEKSNELIWSGGFVIVPLMCFCEVVSFGMGTDIGMQQPWSCVIVGSHRHGFRVSFSTP